MYYIHTIAQLKWQFKGNATLSSKRQKTFNNDLWFWQRVTSRSNWSARILTIATVCDGQTVWCIDNRNSKKTLTVALHCIAIPAPSRAIFLSLVRHIVCRMWQSIKPKRNSKLAQPKSDLTWIANRPIVHYNFICSALAAALRSSKFSRHQWTHHRQIPVSYFENHIWIVMWLATSVQPR